MIPKVVESITSSATCDLRCNVGNLIGTLNLEYSPLLPVSLLHNGALQLNTATSTTPKLFPQTLPAPRGRVNYVHHLPISPSLETTPYWDGWPTGRFIQFFEQQQVADTNTLEVQWMSETFGTRKGSSACSTWEKGKVIQRRCLGVIQCFSTVCGVCIPPAARGVHISQQLCQRCLCGAILQHRECTVHWKLHIYTGGARFENFAKHSHPRFTHTLRVLGKEQPQFTDFLCKTPVNLHNKPPTAGQHVNFQDTEASHGAIFFHNDFTWIPLRTCR